MCVCVRACVRACIGEKSISKNAELVTTVKDSQSILIIYPKSILVTTLLNT